MLLYTQRYTYVCININTGNLKRLEDYTSTSRKLVSSIKILTVMDGLGVYFNYIGKVSHLLTKKKKKKTKAKNDI